MKKIYKLKNLGCSNCSAKMEREIKKLEGVENASVNFMMSRLTIEADETILEKVAQKAASICRRIEPDCRLILKS